MKTKIVQMERGKYRPRGLETTRVTSFLAEDEMKVVNYYAESNCCSVSAAIALIMNEMAKSMNEGVK